MNVESRELMEALDSAIDSVLSDWDITSSRSFLDGVYELRDGVMAKVSVGVHVYSEELLELEVETGGLLENARWE